MKFCKDKMANLGVIEKVVVDLLNFVLIFSNIEEFKMMNLVVFLNPSENRKISKKILPQKKLPNNLTNPQTIHCKKMWEKTKM